MYFGKVLDFSDSFAMTWEKKYLFLGSPGPSWQPPRIFAIKAVILKQPWATYVHTVESGVFNSVYKEEIWGSVAS